nr:DNA polymerase IV [Allostreptomyces psammosilenae]
MAGSERPRPGPEAAPAAVPGILHLDMDAFFAAVEQAAKPSLRGKPVVVGGLGPRGVVATASYEARRFGVHSAMAMAQARRLCPNAAFLSGRFHAYRQVSEVVMRTLRELSPLVEPVSLDEAFVDLRAGVHGAALAEAAERGERAVVAMVEALAEDLRADIRARTGLTASVGVAGTKLLAKLASERAKPDGLVVFPPGRDREVLAPLPVRALWGVGPATAEHLRRAGLKTVGDVAEQPEGVLVRLLGQAHGHGLHALARGEDARQVVAERDAKSISVEDTFDTDLVDRQRLRAELERLARRCVARLREAGRSGRTIVVKVRRHDFATLTRSDTLPAPTDDVRVVTEVARRLLEAVDTSGGVRLLGVGISGLADFTQEDLFVALGGPEDGAAPAADGTGGWAGEPGTAGARADVDGAGGDGAVGGVGPVGASPATGAAVAPWRPGQDVHHPEYGPGWVQGSGVGRVTVRFERPDSPPGRVRTFAVDDPDLTPADPLPLVPPAG